MDPIIMSWEKLDKIFLRLGADVWADNPPLISQWVLTCHHVIVILLQLQTTSCHVRTQISGELRCKWQWFLEFSKRQERMSQEIVSMMEWMRFRIPKTAEMNISIIEDEVPTQHRQTLWAPQRVRIWRFIRFWSPEQTTITTQGCRFQHRRSKDSQTAGESSLVFWAREPLKPQYQHIRGTRLGNSMWNVPSQKWSLRTGPQKSVMLLWKKYLTQVLE